MTTMPQPHKDIVMPYAKELVNDVVIFDTSASDSYVPDMVKDAVELLAIIHSGADEDARGIRVGMPQFIRSLRLYKAAKNNDVSALTATFTTNGATVPFTVKDDAQAVYDRWQAQMNANSEAYKNSPEGIAKANERAQRVADNQRMTDEGFAVLRAIAERDWPVQRAQGFTQPTGAVAARIFSWLASLIDSVDYIGVEWNVEEFRNLLLDFGYKENEAVALDNTSNDINVWRAFYAAKCLKYLTQMGRIAPVAAYMIRKRGLDTETLIPEGMRLLTQYERKQLLDKKLDEGARLWNSESETFEEYLTAMEIPTLGEEK